MAAINTEIPSIAELAEWLNQLVRRYLRQQRPIKAEVSIALLYDVATYWKSDTRRIQAFETNGMRPTEHAAYLAFWIRKLKPISQAFYLCDVDTSQTAGTPIDPTKEIIDINERAAIRLAFAHFAGCCKHGKIITHSPVTGEFLALKYEDSAFGSSVQKYLGQKLDMNGKTVMDKLIHDMRYRSFGPHHLVHIFDQFIFGLPVERIDVPVIAL